MNSTLGMTAIFRKHCDLITRSRDVSCVKTQAASLSHSLSLSLGVQSSRTRCRGYTRRNWVTNSSRFLIDATLSRSGDQFSLVSCCSRPTLMMLLLRGAVAAFTLSSSGVSVSGSSTPLLRAPLRAPAGIESAPSSPSQSLSDITAQITNIYRTIFFYYYYCCYYYYSFFKRLYVFRPAATELDWSAYCIKASTVLDEVRYSRWPAAITSISLINGALQKQWWSGG